MAAARGPLERILEVPAVRGSYVYGPGGEVVARGEHDVQGPAISMGRIGALARHLAGSNQGISETILFFPDALFLLRNLGEYVLVVAADSQVAPSLLRVTVEVSEHEWRARGLDRTFSRGKDGASGAGRWRKLLGGR